MLGGAQRILDRTTKSRSTESSLQSGSNSTYFPRSIYKIGGTYLPLFVYIAAIHCLEQQILCDICVDENSHKCAICHHKLKTNNFALKTYHVTVDSHCFKQQISLFIKAHQPMFLTVTAPYLTYL